MEYVIHKEEFLYARCRTKRKTFYRESHTRLNENFSYLDLRMGRLNVSIYGHVLSKIAWRHCIDFGRGCRWKLSIQSAYQSSRIISCF